MLFADLVQEVTTDIVYATNARICLFQSKLYNIDTASGLGVLVVEGDNYVQYRVFGSTKQLPAYFQLTYTHPMLQICTTPNQDIRSIVRAEFGDVDKVTVTEVLEIPNTCENGQPFNVKYFGRSVRLVLNSTETSEFCNNNNHMHTNFITYLVLLGLVVPAQCSEKFDYCVFPIMIPSTILLFRHLLHDYKQLSKHQ